MKGFLSRLMPDRERIRQNRWLRWLGPRLMHPRLWHFSRRGVAIGVGLGVFFGLLIPVAQIPFAASVAVLLRANVPAAIGSTLVTNPVTFAPIYIIAYRLGATLLGEPTPTAADLPEELVVAPDDEDPVVGWWSRAGKAIAALGGPLLLGLGIMATVFGFLTWLLISLAWRIKTTINWQRRRRRRRPS
jgi:uncharacterized protein (DUF2062 family)